ncbi:hypothetical protein ACIQU2_27515 [Pseudomonas sp. NPDC098740]|uniref:hypothetical protein n=1 Tax=Pseudomonas sp. NPDC098740 TaxID=3364486 RepID=UPI00383BBD22
MNEDAIYYQMKGLLSEMEPEEQAAIEQACAEVLAIAKRSDLALVGVSWACVILKREQKAMK